MRTTKPLNRNSFSNFHNSCHIAHLPCHLYIASVNLAGDQGGEVSQDIQVRLRELDRSVGDWLADSETKSYRTLASVIRRFLRQKGIEQHFEVEEIFIDTYLRARQKIEKGEDIENYRGWIRKAAYFIVCEKKRTISKAKSLISRIEDEAKVCGNLRESLDLSIDLNYELLYQALKCLKEEEIEIISLRFWDELSWQEVVESSSLEGIRESSIPALRKRQQRIIEKLKEIVRSLIQEESELAL